MFNDKTNIGISFYTTNNAPTKNWRHRVAMWFLNCTGHRYGHVEAQDRNFKHWGIYVGDTIHVQEERKTFDVTGKNSYYTLQVTQAQYRDFFYFFLKKEKKSSFNYSVYLPGVTFNMGPNKFYCSELIAEALLYAKIYKKKKWPKPHKISPDKLYNLLKDDLVLGNPTRGQLCHDFHTNRDQNKNTETTIDPYELNIVIES